MQLCCKTKMLSDTTLLVARNYFLISVGGAIIFSAASSATGLLIYNSTFSKNNAITAGGVMVMGYFLDLSICNSSFVSNTARESAGVYIASPVLQNLNIENSTFSYNTGTYLAGAIDIVTSPQSPAKITNSNFEYNSGYLGADIYAKGPVELQLRDNQFSSGRSDVGGTVWVNGNLTVENSTFFNCSGGQNGGTIYHYGDSSSTVQLSYVTFDTCSASFGSVLFLDGAFDDVIMTDTAIRSCVSSEGGAVYTSRSGSNIKLSNILAENNSGGTGVLMYIPHDVHVDNVDIQSVTSSHNSATGNGATVSVLGTVGEFSLKNSVVQNNKANSGSLYLSGATMSNIYNVSFLDNSATQDGAAIFCAGGQTNVTDCQFVDNSAVDGGALYIAASSTAKRQSSQSTTISGSKFQQNSASGSGGAILSNGDVTVSKSSFTQNSAGTKGSDVSIETGTFSLYDSSAKVYLSPSAQLSGDSSAIVSCPMGQQSSQNNGVYSCVPESTTLSKGAIAGERIKPKYIYEEFTGNVGIVVGVVIFVALVIGLIVILFLHGRKQREMELEMARLNLDHLMVEGVVIGKTIGESKFRSRRKFAENSRIGKFR